MTPLIYFIEMACVQRSVFALIFHQPIFRCAVCVVRQFVLRSFFFLVFSVFIFFLAKIKHSNKFGGLCPMNSELIAANSQMLGIARALFYGDKLRRPFYGLQFVAKINQLQLDYTHRLCARATKQIKSRMVGHMCVFIFER